MVEGLETKLDFERMFTREELDTIGDRWLIKWRGSQTLRYGIYLDLVRNVLVTESTARFLDIGCAQSNLLILLNQEYRFIQYYGTDISENVISWNQKQYPFVRYEQCALPEVGFPSNRFDFISALEVVYYLGEQQRLQSLQNMSAALKPGGYMLISGGLDGGRSYFAEDWIVQTVAGILSIERVEYNYARCYSWLERWFLRAHRVFNTACQLIDLPESEFQKRLAMREGWRKRIAPILRLSTLRPVVRTVTQLSLRLLRAVLGWVWLPRICSKMTRWLMGNNGKSHIIILARKEQLTKLLSEEGIE